MKTLGWSKTHPLLAGLYHTCLPGSLPRGRRDSTFIIQHQQTRIHSHQSGCINITNSADTEGVELPVDTGGVELSADTGGSVLSAGTGGVKMPADSGGVELSVDTGGVVLSADTEGSVLSAGTGGVELSATLQPKI